MAEREELFTYAKKSLSWKKKPSQTFEMFEIKEKKGVL